MSRNTLIRRLADSRPLLLDGAMGTELARRRVSLETPAWSAAALLHHPQLISQIHCEYVEAGAELITANTFRTHRWNLGKVGKASQCRELTRLAVGLARSVAGGCAWVAGSLAPLEDCYRPERTPADVDLDREHCFGAEVLAEAGVDVILAETHPTIRESVAAACAAEQVGLPFMVSWVCGRDGRLLSGEALGSAVAAVLVYSPLAVLVNCLPTETAERAVDDLLKAAGDVPVGVYANVGWNDPQQGWVQGEGVEPASYAEYAEAWIKQGVRVVGGCCGTTPAHIEQLKRTLDARPEIAAGDRKRIELPRAHLSR